MKNCNTCRVFILFFVTLLFINPGLAQENNKPVKKVCVGLEVQWYPAGWMVGPVASFSLAHKHSINIRIAANIADRHDWGKNDDEKGTGYGGSLGYRFLFTPGKNSFFVGARVDLWRMKIDWKDKINAAPATSGQTKITIFQPTAEAGYNVMSKTKKWNFVFSAAAGQEINIRTTGKEVGEGGIFLLSASAYFVL